MYTSLKNFSNKVVYQHTAMKLYRKAFGDQYNERQSPYKRDAYAYIGVMTSELMKNA